MTQSSSHSLVKLKFSRVAPYYIHGNFPTRGKASTYMLIKLLSNFEALQSNLKPKY